MSSAVFPQLFAIVFMFLSCLDCTLMMCLFSHYPQTRANSNSTFLGSWCLCLIPHISSLREKRQMRTVISYKCVEHIDNLALCWEDHLCEEDPVTFHLHHLFSQILLLPSLPASSTPIQTSFLSSLNRRLTSSKRVTYEAFDSLLSWFFFSYLLLFCSISETTSF